MRRIRRHVHGPVHLGDAARRALTGRPQGAVTDTAVGQEAAIPVLGFS